jgi:hypothetical protein
MSNQRLISPQEWRAQKTAEAFRIPGNDLSEITEKLKKRSLPERKLTIALAHFDVLVRHGVELNKEERQFLSEIMNTILNSADLTQRVARSMGTTLNSARWAKNELARDILKPIIEDMVNAPNPPMHNEMANIFQEKGLWPGSRKTLLEFLRDELQKLGRKDLVYNKNNT